MSLWLTHPLFIPSLVVGITILLWATSLLPEFITALLFFAVAMVAKDHIRRRDFGDHRHGILQQPHAVRPRPAG